MLFTGSIGFFLFVFLNYYYLREKKGERHLFLWQRQYSMD